ncbi:RipA family octameric membrane protein [Pseudoalteromonas sp. T1lg21]|uniref:RipA family octameric membrane protein n=1 Tax=Pseudoalteromonas sp. T1lg21 TaxID=2077095 RepID=UPI0018F86590|nr:hypothetical protein [Pseudoalteromonas sp. T1lg21]
MSKHHPYEVDNESYNKMFEDKEQEEKGAGVNLKSKKEKALEHALDIRKFEIELYWKRATYFWALIAVTFAGFFGVISSNIKPTSDKEVYVFVIGCIGLFFTWAWFLVNKGSKYWQENWENHVNMLENDIIGPLYKTSLERPDDDGFIEDLVTGPAKLSVSKINQWVSLFTLVVWLGLLLSVFDWGLHTASLYQALSFNVVVFFMVMTLKESTSYHGNHHHIMNTRKSNVVKRGIK